MDTDLALVIGIIVGAFSIPSIVSAMTDNRTPRIASIAVVVSGGLVAYALTQQPGGYSLGDIPNVIVKVIARYIG